MINSWFYWLITNIWILFCIRKKMDPLIVQLWRFKCLEKIIVYLLMAWGWLPTPKSGIRIRQLLNNIPCSIAHFWQNSIIRSIVDKFPVLTFQFLLHFQVDPYPKDSKIYKITDPIFYPKHRQNKNLKLPLSFSILNLLG